MKSGLKYFLLLILAGILLFFSWMLIPNRTLSKEYVLEKYTSPQSKFYKWNDINVHYIEEGEGSTILMIHGFGGSHRNFSKLAGLLKTDYRVIRVDLPGFALSDVPQGYTANDDLVGLYRSLMKDFIPDVVGDTFFVMGNSMGGWMAWEIAAVMPEKISGMVLLCAAGYEMDKVVNTVVPLLRLKPVQFVLSRGMPLAISKKNLKNLYADPSKISMENVKVANDFKNREGVLPWMMMMATSGDRPDTSKISTIQVPTLIIWGEKDRLIPVEHASKFNRDIKGSEKIIYPDAGHLPMLEKPEQVYADFKKWTADKGGLTSLISE